MPRSLKKLVDFQITDSNIEEVSYAVAVMSGKRYVKTPDDVAQAVHVIDKITNHTSLTQLTTSDIIWATSYMMETDEDNLMNSQINNYSLTTLVTSLESMMGHVQLENASFSYRTPNIAMLVTEINSSNVFYGVGLSKTENITTNVFKTCSTNRDYSQVEAAAFLQFHNKYSQINSSLNGTTKIGFMMYKNSILFPRFDNANRTNITTPVISVSNFNNDQKSKVELIFPSFYNSQQSDCVFWDFTLNDNLGGWSHDGCTFQGRIDGHVICKCDHMTNFAVLATWDPKAEINKNDRIILGIISLIGLSISSISLTCTLTTFFAFR